MRFNRRKSEKVARGVLSRFGLRIVRQGSNVGYPHDVDDEFVRICERSRPFTMTSVERMLAVYRAVEYVVRYDIPGDFVECGVWAGGISMVAAHSLQHFGDTSRSVYLYDTFEGMSEPTEKDVRHNGELAMARWSESQTGDHNSWCYAPLEEVRKNMESTGFPSDRIVYVKGKVEDTIPGTMPERVSVLRLDTDFYESSYHELKHLYPILSSRGLLALDDYGHWEGAREATDRFFEELGDPVFLSRIDAGSRVWVKP